MSDPVKNRIKYGLCNVYYAEITQLSTSNVPTYGTPVALPGAVSISLSPEGDTTPFYADNIEYYTSIANNGYSGTLELALIPDSFRTDILGETVDSKNVMFEDAAATTTYFALMFQFEGDQNQTRHVLYKCTAARPDVASSTKQSSIEAQTETLNITATAIHNATLDTDIVKARTNEETDSTTYTGWFSDVVLPTASSQSS